MIKNYPSKMMKDIPRKPAVTDDTIVRIMKQTDPTLKKKRALKKFEKLKEDLGI